MLRLYVSLWGMLTGAVQTARRALTAGPRGGRLLVSELGQTTAEYALVILAAAAVAIVLIAWARASGKLPAFFDHIIDSITSSAQ